MISNAANKILFLTIRKLKTVFLRFKTINTISNPLKYLTMKALRNILFLLVCVSMIDVVLAQNTYPQNPNCTGLKNPSNFTFTGGYANAIWKGYTGTKPTGVSQCNNISASLPTEIQASQLESITSSSSCYSVSGAYLQSRRFLIMGSGTDAVTNNNLSYQPPRHIVPHLYPTRKLLRWCRGRMSHIRIRG